MSRVALATSGLFGPELFPDSMLVAALAVIDKAVRVGCMPPAPRQKSKAKKPSSRKPRKPKPRTVTKVYALFSGGHDSVTAASVASKHPLFAGVVHLNTGTGLTKTREYVYDTARQHGWPLIEMHPTKYDYRWLVLNRGGFPSGRKSHNTMYYYLKQMQIRRLVQEQKTHAYDRVGLVTGVRLQESHRRMTAALGVEVRRDGNQLWINPILPWTKDDNHAYMAQQGIKRNLVVDLIHRSAECLCGGLARREEFKEIEFWFPEDPSVLMIQDLQRECKTRGLRSCEWATKPPRSRAEPKQEQWADLPMCVGCMKGYAA